MKPLNNEPAKSGNLQKTITALGWAGAGLLAAALTARVAKTVLGQTRAINLSGKVVVLTGGSRGLGLVTARLLVAQNVKIVLVARNENALRDAKANLLETVPNAVAQNIAFFAADVTERESAGQVVRFAEQTYGPVDILINNAGTIQVGPMEAMTEGDYEQSLRTHFWGPYRLIEAVLPTMRARKFGRIVNVASIGGKIAVPHMLPYSTGKFALVGYSEGLRAELIKNGIYVTTFCPGLIRTGSPDNAQFKGQHEKEFAWFTISDSLPGVTQSAEACASAIVDALVHGHAEVITTLPAKVGAAFHGVFPGATSEVMGVVNRTLPAADGPNSVGTQIRTGRESRSSLAPPALTALTDEAAKRNNQG